MSPGAVLTPTLVFSFARALSGCCSGLLPSVIPTVLDGDDGGGGDDDEGEAFDFNDSDLDCAQAEAPPPPPPAPPGPDGTDPPPAPPTGALSAADAPAAAGTSPLAGGASARREETSADDQGPDLPPPPPAPEADAETDDGQAGVQGRQLVCRLRVTPRAACRDVGCPQIAPWMCRTLPGIPHIPPACVFGLSYLALVRAALSPPTVKRQGQCLRRHLALPDVTRAAGCLLSVSRKSRRRTQLLSVESK